MVGELLEYVDSGIALVSVIRWAVS